MKTLITGGTGLVGSTIKAEVKLCTKDVDLRDWKSTLNIFEEIKPERVVHCAARVGGLGGNMNYKGEYFYDNMMMNINVLEASRRVGVKKVVSFLSTCVFPNDVEYPLKENKIHLGEPHHSNYPYAHAKRMVDIQSRAYNEQYGFNGVNLVPVNMYGPHDHFNLTSSHVIPALILKFYNAMKEGDSSVTLWGTGQVSREFLFAPDCAEAIRLAIEKDVSPEPINIGTGKEIKICDLAQEIAEQMGYEGKIIYDTSKPDGQPRRCLDTSRAKERLGFEAKTDLKDGLKQTIEWSFGEQK